MQAVDIILFGCAIVFLAWAFQQLLRHRRENDRLQAQKELHRMLIEKVASSESLKVYLESEAFRKGVLEPAPEEEIGRRQVGGGLPTGVALLVFGVGSILAPYSNDGPKLVGVLAIVVAAGFLGAGIVSHRIARSWKKADQKRLRKTDEP
jgi:uncharacterized membrane protein